MSVPFLFKYNKCIGSMPARRRERVQSYLI